MMNATLPESVWRNFDFFGSQELVGTVAGVDSMTCVCVDYQHIFIGDFDGRVHVLDSTGAVSELTLPAYTGPVTHMKYVRANDVLVTLGDDDALNVAVMRVWHLDQCKRAWQDRLQHEGKEEAGGARASWRPPHEEHRLFSAKDPAPSETVSLNVNFNAERLRTLRFSSQALPSSSPTIPGSPGDEGTPADSLRTVATSFDVATDLLTGVVGLSTGECLVLHGDFGRGRTSGGAGLKQRRIRSSTAKGALNFVCLPDPRHVRIARASSSATSSSPSSSSNSGVVLLAVYEDLATAWHLPGSQSSAEHARGSEVKLAEYILPIPFGAAPQCVCALEDGKLVVASATGPQVALLGFPGMNEKQQCSASHKPAPVSPGYDPTDPSATQIVPLQSPGGGPVRRAVVSVGTEYIALLTQHPNRPAQMHLQCYDVSNHIRALSRAQEALTNCAFLAAPSGAVAGLLVFAQDPAAKVVSPTQLCHRVVRLTEVDLQTKLELLFKKECYDVASRVCERMNSVDPALQVNIQKRYGDYLYTRGRYAEAMEQYIQTIGYVEPSYVVRKYIDGQRIDYLTSYLEELHSTTSRGSNRDKAQEGKRKYQATVTHTTLLLRCYIRQRQGDRLNAFIRRADVRFDPDNAIAVCREGGYYDAALHIADSYALPHARVGVLLHDLHKADAVLQYVRTLGVEAAEEVLQDCGRTLVLLEPVQATQLLMELCVRWGGPARRLPMIAGGSSAETTRKPHHRAEAKEFIRVFVDSPVCLLNFLRAVIESGVLEDADGAEAGAGSGGGHRVLYNTLLELFICVELPRRITMQDMEDGAGTGEPMHASASAEQFEIESLEKRRQQALFLLEGHVGRYDNYVALGLVYQHHFEAGIELLLRRLCLSSELLHLYNMQLERATSSQGRAEATERLLGVCQTMTGSGGAAEHQLEQRAVWMELLSLLARSPAADWQDIARVLEHVERRDLLSPVIVLDILSSAPRELPLQTVRNMCLRVLQRQAECTRAAQAQSAQALAAATAVERETKLLHTRAVVFQSSQCAHCLQSLDLPVVHFMCRHRFHHRCLHIATECNVCGPQRRHQEAERRQQQQQHCLAQRLCKAEADMEGRKQLGGGLKVLADCIGEGAFEGHSMHLFDTSRSGGGDARAHAELMEEAAMYDDKNQLVRPEDIELW